MRDYRECGEKFRLGRLTDAQARPGWAALAGSAFHTVSEEIDYTEHAGMLSQGYDAYLAATLAEFERNIAEAELDTGWPREQFRAYGYRPPQGYDYYVNTGLPNAIRSFLEWRLTSGWEVADIVDFGPGIELPFEVEIGQVVVKGRIDRVMTDGKGFYVFDYKSGNKPKAIEQLGLYSYALREQYDTHIEWGYYIYGLKRGSVELAGPANLAHFDHDHLAPVYKEADRGIESGIFVPNPGEACFFCDYTHACEFFRNAL